MFQVFVGDLSNISFDLSIKW